MGQTQQRTVQIWIRTTPAVKARLESLARHDDRTAAYIAEKAIVQYLNKREKE
jgi:predicted transcriptional regulator